jgi:16S rRNA (adenine1518-N6/adenine1519-N6)-dimethyltransferase
VFKNFVDLTFADNNSYSNPSPLVRPKKFLGQHFLTDQNIAQKITDSLAPEKRIQVLEIGPGTGVLTRYLVTNTAIDLKVAEIDRESIAYLKKNFPGLVILEGDFLEMKMPEIFTGNFSIIGNFPYNISSQIFFKVLQHYNQIDTVVCMLQKEVGDRIASPPGNKTYGILSVLLQAFYDIEGLFSVPPDVFIPPPKVMSTVIRLKRNKRVKLDCDESAFFKVVKQGFNNRRKTLRNALKSLNLAAEYSALPIFNQRAEQLTVDEFVYITQLMEKSRAGTGAI